MTKLQKLVRTLLIVTIPALTLFSSCSAHKVSTKVCCKGKTICTNYHQTGGLSTCRIETNNMDLYVEMKGDIRVTENDRDIKSISPGGYLKFSQKTFGNKRTISIESDSNGQLTRKFYENRSEIPYEPEGRKWMSEVLIEVIRASGIDAENRAKRIFMQSGFDAFITEINQIDRSSIKADYFAGLLSIPTIKTSDLVQIAENIPVRISSETECAQLYRKHANVFMADPDACAAYLRSVAKMYSNTERGSVLRTINPKIDINNPLVSEAYFNVVNRLESSTEKGSVLRDLIAEQELSDDTYISFLVATKKISSNTELASVLRAIKKPNFTSREIIEAYFAAVTSLSSNTEAGRVLRDLYKKQSLGNDALLAYLFCAKRITSNVELGSIMRNMSKIDLGNKDIMKAYFATVNSISSDTEKGRVLRNLINSQKLNNDAQIEFLYATKRLSSNTELGYTMRDFIPHLNREKGVIEAFFLTTNTIASNTEHGRVLRELIEHGNLNHELIMGVLHSTKRLSSNTEKASVLTELASIMPKEESYIKEFKVAASTISSQSEHERVMRSLK